jgi:hypothetical protein
MADLAPEIPVTGSNAPVLTSNRFVSAPDAEIASPPVREDINAINTDADTAVNSTGSGNKAFYLQEGNMRYDAADSSNGHLAEGINVPDEVVLDFEDGDYLIQSGEKMQEPKTIYRVTKGRVQIKRTYMFKGNPRTTISFR